MTGRIGLEHYFFQIENHRPQNGIIHFRYCARGARLGDDCGHVCSRFYLKFNR